MNVVTRIALVSFWEKHPKAKGPLASWFALAKAAEWKSPQDIKDQFGSNVDFVGDNRVIFDIGGSNYRLIVRVSYTFKQVLVKFVGTHAEYDDINAETI